jgi:putative SOS response-associated peptidase YedK
MCGRYSLARGEAPWSFAEVRLEWNGQARYNVGPMQRAPVIRRRGGRAEIDELTWGLIPSWSRDTGIAARCINARSETVASQPAFRSAFARSRCLVPADSFYEWQAEGRVKLPWRFLRKDATPLLFAGLWESWCPPTEPERRPVETFTVLTTRPSGDILPVHDRMPVILSGSAAADWLDPEKGAEELLQLCVPLPEGTLRRYRVTPRMNSVAFDTAECLLPVECQAELF